MAAGIAADPELDGGAVRHEVGDELADSALHVAELGDRVLVRGGVDLYRKVDVVNVDEALAECARYRPVELDDHGPGGADRGVHRLDRDAEGAEAVGVGWRRIDEDRIERKRSRIEEPRHVRQEYRHVVCAALVHGCARIGSDEQGAVAEVAGHLGREVRPGSLDVEMDDTDVMEFRRSFDERIEQDGRGRRGTVDVHLVPGSDRIDGLLGADSSHEVILTSRPWTRGGVANMAHWMREPTACHTAREVICVSPDGPSRPRGRAKWTSTHAPVQFTVTCIGSTCR